MKKLNFALFAEDGSLTKLAKFCIYCLIAILTMNLIGFIIGVIVIFFNFILGMKIIAAASILFFIQLGIICG